MNITFKEIVRKKIIVLNCICLTYFLLNSNK